MLNPVIFILDYPRLLEPILTNTWVMGPSQPAPSETAGHDDEVLTDGEQRTRIPQALQDVAKGQVAQHTLQGP